MTVHHHLDWIFLCLWRLKYNSLMGKINVFWINVTCRVQNSGEKVYKTSMNIYTYWLCHSRFPMYVWNNFDFQISCIVSLCNGRLRKEQLHVQQFNILQTIYCYRSTFKKKRLEYESGINILFSLAHQLKKMLQPEESELSFTQSIETEGKQVLCNSLVSRCS